MRNRFDCARTTARNRFPGWCVSLLLLVPMLLSIAAITPAATAQTEPDVAGAYTLNVTFEGATRTIKGSLLLDWRNETGQTQFQLPFRLYPNAPQYEQSGTEVSAVSVNGASVNAATSPEDATVLLVPLPQPVAAGDSVTVGMDFVTRIPTDSGMAINVLAGSMETGWWLADWYPILAGWESATGWYLDPPTSLGNPTFADTASYELTMTLPLGYEIASTGVMRADTVSLGDTRSVRIETPAARDLTLALVSDAEVTERQVGDVLVRVVLPEAMAVPGLAESMLEIAAEIIPQYEAWFGALPTTKLDLSPMGLSGFGGIAWSGSIWLDLETFVAAGEVLPGDRDMLHFVLAHELAHQWFPIAVGSNNNRYGFMSESLANQLAVRAIAATGHADLADQLFQHQIVAPYTRLLEVGDGVVNAPITDSSALSARGALVYGKGALGFEAIRQAMGDDAYFGALADFTRLHWFAVAEPADLLVAFTRRGGDSVGPLWGFWFEQDTATLSDVEALNSP